jgi:DNA replication protein DnaC
MHCDKHNIDYEAKHFTLGNTVFYLGCPLCEQERERQLEQSEENERRALEVRKMQEMNIEPEFYGASFDTYQTDIPEQTKAVQTVQRLIEGKIQQIVMVGSNGTGKTHLAIAAVKALGGKIFSMYEITTRIRQSYSARSDETELDIVDELARLPMLAIDEVGRTKGSDAELNWLSYIIDKRHTRGLPTIIISNKHVRKHCPLGGCPECLENYLSNDVMSRLTEGGVLLQFNWEDWRKRGVNHEN